MFNGIIITVQWEITVNGKIKIDEFLERTKRLVGVLLGAFQLQGFGGLGFKSCESCGFEPIVT